MKNKNLQTISSSFALLLFLNSCSCLCKKKKEEQEALKQKQAQEQLAFYADEIQAKEDANKLKNQLTLNNKDAIQIDNLTVFFDFDQYDIKSTEKEKIKLQKEFLLNSKIKNLKIEGHADQRGSEEYNMVLSQKRANAVKNQICPKGAVCKVIPFGKTRLIDKQEKESAYAKNRRAVTIIDTK